MTNETFTPEGNNPEACKMFAKKKGHLDAVTTGQKTSSHTRPLIKTHEECKTIGCTVRKACDAIIGIGIGQQTPLSKEHNTDPSSDEDSLQ